jgi:hypothetical protein
MRPRRWDSVRADRPGRTPFYSYTPKCTRLLVVVESVIEWVGGWVGEWLTEWVSKCLACREPLACACAESGAHIQHVGLPLRSRGCFRSDMGQKRQCMNMSRMLALQGYHEQPHYSYSGKCSSQQAAQHVPARGLISAAEQRGTVACIRSRLLYGTACWVSGHRSPSQTYSWTARIVLPTACLQSPPPPPRAPCCRRIQLAASAFPRLAWPQPLWWSRAAHVASLLQKPFQDWG